MTRVPAVVVSTLAASIALVSAQQPQFRAGTHTVSVYATAIDSAGRLVPDLTRQEFEIYDNGKRQELTVFANDVQPITVVIMLDRSGSVAGHFGLVRDAAAAFVANLLPTDKARLGSFSSDVVIDPETFTSNPDELLEILDTRLQEAGPTPLWRAAGAAMDALAGEHGRRVVLVFTDGYDSPFKLGASTTFAEVRERSQAEGIMVYGVGLAQECGLSSARRSRDSADVLFQRGGTGRGRPGRGVPGRGPRGIPLPRPPIPPVLLPPRQPPRLPAPEPSDVYITPCAESKPDPGLRELAEVGGGGYFELQTAADLKATFARVADELHRQYLLGFPATSLDEKLHRLEVRVRRDGVKVRARTSYLAR